MSKDIKLALEDKLNAVDDSVPEAPRDAEAPQPQIVYGIHVMMMSDGNPHVEISGTPSYAKILRLLNEVSTNITAELIAERVVLKLAQSTSKIARATKL